MIKTIRTPSAPIDALIAEHGARRVLWRALRALLAPSRPPPPSGDALNAHLRRDIGLPPADRRAEPWDYLR